MLIDSHVHIYSEQFDEDRDIAIENAMNVGVKHFFLPSINSSYTQSMIDVETKYPNNVHLMMGLHPTSVKKETVEQELSFVRKWIDKRSFAAIGEIGIDLYWDKTFLKEQQMAFSTQIDWSIEKDLPIVIHCRDSFDEIFEILEEKKSPKLRGIFHCFTGDLAQAKKAIGYNMKLGIGGVITFKNGKIDKFMHEIDLKHLVLETDAPYLAPAPNRGKRNEPKYIPIIVEKLCSIYNSTPKEISEITSKNALEIFNDYKV